MKIAKLSKTMQDAVQFANEHGGKLVRHPGGFWSSPEFALGHGVQWFGTSTVESLVNRGIFSYTQWIEGKTSRFPVEVTVNHAF